MGTFQRVVTLHDIEAIEATPLSERWTPTCTYDVIEKTALGVPDRPAITFLLAGAPEDEGLAISYRSLFDDITRTANLLRSLGVSSEKPAAVILPNLPHTHYAIWGTETAGAAAPINPLLEPNQIAATLNAIEAHAIVTLVPTSLRKRPTRSP